MGLLPGYPRSFESCSKILVDKYSAQVNTIFLEEIPALNKEMNRENIGVLKILPKEELMKEN